MRIVLCQKYISRHGQGGGLSTLYANLALGLAELGVDVALLTATPPTETGLSERLPIHQLPADADDQRYAERVAAALQQIPHDLVETPTWKTELVEHLRLPAERRSAVVVRTELPLARLLPGHPALERERALIQAADALIAVSPFVARCVAEEYGRAPAATVLNGVDTQLFRRLPAVAPARQQTLWVGDYNPVKRLELLVAIVRAAPSWRHHIVIPEPQGAAQQAPYEHLRVLPNATLSHHLPQEELVRLYNRASVILSTSRYEAFGLSLVEGLACGTPLLTPVDLESVEHLLAGGESGREFRDAASAAALLRETDWASMRGAALELAGEFRWERCAHETLALYEGALRERARH